MKDDKYFIDLEKEDYFNTLDKRSKEYREYKDWLSYKKLKSNVDKKSNVGLGDALEAITKATGIKKVVEAVIDDCGCDERKEKFNKIPLWSRRKVNCIEQDDYVWLKKLLTNKSIKYTLDVRNRLLPIYTYVFNTKPIKDTTCVSCLNGYTKELRKYLEVYDN